MAKTILRGVRKKPEPCLQRGNNEIIIDHSVQRKYYVSQYWERAINWKFYIPLRQSSRIKDQEKAPGKEKLRVFVSKRFKHND